MQCYAVCLTFYTTSDIHEPHHHYSEICPARPKVANAEISSNTMERLIKIITSRFASGLVENLTVVVVKTKTPLRRARSLGSDRKPWNIIAAVFVIVARMMQFLFGDSNLTQLPIGTVMEEREIGKKRANEKKVKVFIFFISNVWLHTISAFSLLDVTIEPCSQSRDFLLKFDVIDGAVRAIWRIGTN